MRALILGAALMPLSAWACDLKVQGAWLREAPSNASVLAGYATLSNGGSKPLNIVGVQSIAFATVELHESMNENGMAKMRAIDKLEIAPGKKVAFAPGGRHFMLINPKLALRSGDNVAVKITDSTGCEFTTQFKVSKDAGEAVDAKMDHSQMDHSKMDHSKMDHAMP